MCRHDPYACSGETGAAQTAAEPPNGRARIRLTAKWQVRLTKNSGNDTIITCKRLLVHPFSGELAAFVVRRSPGACVCRRPCDGVENAPLSQRFLTMRMRECFCRAVGHRSRRIVRRGWWNHGPFVSCCISWRLWNGQQPANAAAFFRIREAIGEIGMEPQARGD